MPTEPLNRTRALHTMPGMCERPYNRALSSPVPSEISQASTESRSTGLISTTRILPSTTARPGLVSDPIELIPGTCDGTSSGRPPGPARHPARRPAGPAGLRLAPLEQAASLGRRLVPVRRGVLVRHLGLFGPYLLVGRFRGRGRHLGRLALL